MRLGRQTLLAYCDTAGVVEQVPGDAKPALIRFRQQLEKRLAKKGIEVAWQPAPDGCNLCVHLVEVDRGRPYLVLPMAVFGGPLLSSLVPAARVRVFGVLTTSSQDMPPTDFMHIAKASTITAKSGIRVCADRAAKQTARTARRWLKNLVAQALRARPV
ncbi:MAG: hypothetical protein JW889_14560 [Verrucomicrobia bacterium]|nr:hypothetical protein [Verrucomicrobiota bacterium]